MPRADQLPAALVPIIYRNTHEILERRWRHDTARLVAVLERHLELEPQVEDGDASAGPSPATVLLSAVVAHVPRDFLRLLFGADPLSCRTRVGVGERIGTTTGLPADRADSRRGAGASRVADTVAHPSVPACARAAWPARRPRPLGSASSGVARGRGVSNQYHRVLTILLYQCSFVGLGESLFTVVMLTGIAMTRPLALPGLAADLSIETLHTTIESLQAAPDPIAWVIASFISTPSRCTSLPGA